MDFKFGTDHGVIGEKKIDTFRSNLAELKLIIIDEVSMVSSDMLYHIHARLCDIFQNTKLFGGIGIMLVGDLLQLRPVEAKYIFQRPKTQKFQVLYNSEDSLWNSFEVVNLVHNHRQGDGSRWADTLNRFRDGSFTKEDDVKVIEDRVIKDDSIGELKDACHVFYTNREVSGHNEMMLLSLGNPLFETMATYRSPPGYKPQIQKHGVVAQTPLQHKLQIKVGARIMLVVNVNTFDGLVNGAMGSVVDIVMYPNYSKHVKCIIIAFDRPDVGKAQREKHPQYSEKYSSVNGTPIFIHDFRYYLPCYRKKSAHGATATVSQFPLRLAWAITCHKMQVS